MARASRGRPTTSTPASNQVKKPSEWRTVTLPWGTTFRFLRANANLLHEQLYGHSGVLNEQETLQEIRRRASVRIEQDIPRPQMAVGSRNVRVIERHQVSAVDRIQHRGGAQRDHHDWATADGWLSTSLLTARRAARKYEDVFPETRRTWTVTCTCCSAPPPAPIEHGECVVVESAITESKGCKFALGHGHPTIERIPTEKNGKKYPQPEYGPWKKLPPHILTNIPGCEEFQEYPVHIIRLTYNLRRFALQVWGEELHPLDNKKNWDWLNPEHLDSPSNRDYPQDLIRGIKQPLTALEWPEAMREWREAQLPQHLQRGVKQALDARKWADAVREWRESRRSGQPRYQVIPFPAKNHSPGIPWSAIHCPRHHDGDGWGVDNVPSNRDKLRTRSSYCRATRRGNCSHLDGQPGFIMSSALAPEIEIRRLLACGDEKSIICALRLTTRSVDRVLAPGVIEVHAAKGINEDDVKAWLKAHKPAQQLSRFLRVWKEWQKKVHVIPGAFYNERGSIEPFRWLDKTEFSRYRKFLLQHVGPQPSGTGRNSFGATCAYWKWDGVGRQLERVVEKEKNYGFMKAKTKFVTHSWVAKAFSVEEIAARMGCSVSKAEKHLAEGGVRKNRRRVPSGERSQDSPISCPEPVLEGNLGQELAGDGD